MATPTHRLLGNEHDGRLEPLEFGAASVGYEEYVGGASSGGISDGDGGAPPSPFDAFVDACRLRLTRAVLAVVTAGVALQALSYKGGPLGSFQLRCVTGQEATDFPAQLLPPYEWKHPVAVTLSAEFGWKASRLTGVFQFDRTGRRAPPRTPYSDPTSFSYNNRYDGSRISTSESGGSGGGGFGGGGGGTGEGGLDPWMNGTRVPSEVYVVAVHSSRRAQRAWQNKDFSPSARFWARFSQALLWATAAAGTLGLPIAFLTAVSKGSGQRLHRTTKTLLWGVVVTTAVLAVLLLAASVWAFPTKAASEVAVGAAEEAHKRLQHLVDRQVKRAVMQANWAMPPPCTAWEKCVPTAVAMDPGYWYGAAAAVVLAANAAISYVALKAPGRARPAASGTPSPWGA